MPRIITLGCGTGVGKTRVSAALLRELAARALPCMGLKPVESGIEVGELGLPPSGSDAALLSAAGAIATTLRHPLYALPEPISPHLAAQRSGTIIELTRISRWVTDAEADVALALHAWPSRALWSVVETAGGVLSPLGPKASNFDLALALEPALWILVAADSLGVLHDVSATCEAMAARGRTPDHLVLSQAREPDASTGSNVAELTTLGIATPSALLARNDDRGIATLVDRLLAQCPHGTR